MSDNTLPDFSAIWPEWKAVKKVGEGSFGKVFKCVRKEYDIETECAIKVVSIPKNESEINAIRAEYSNAEESVRAHFKDIVEEFANEIKMMVLLKGAPNIVSVENYKIVERKDTIGWDIYIQMEFLTTFTEFAKNNNFTERAVARLATDLCGALEVCAEKNIIHRDIKPDNIFIDNYGNYKIGDFGVARKLENASSAMSKKGTYTYMAPEVYHSAAYDNRADIYSLGMVMYKLLNRGRDPFTNPLADSVPYKEREAALVKRMRGENLPAPVDASLNMAKIIIKACSFEPKNRFASPSEFKAALIRYSENAPESGNKPVNSKVGFGGNTGSKSAAQSKTNKSLPLFRDDMIQPNPQTAAVNGSANGQAGNFVPAVRQPQNVAVRQTQSGAIQRVEPVNQQRVQPVQAVPVEQPVKKGKGKIVATIIVLIILAVAGAVGYFVYEDYEQTRQEQIKQDIKLIDQIKTDFMEFDIDYAEAENRLSKYLKSSESEVKKKAQNIRSDIAAVKADVGYHSEAEALMEEGKDYKALKLLEKVSIDYPKYVEVADLIFSIREKVDGYKNEQKVYIVDGSPEIYTYNGGNCIRFSITNNSSKAIAKTYISSLEYDSSRDPVTTYSGEHSNENYYLLQSTIYSKTTHNMKNSNEYWDKVSSSAKYARACVRYVEYTDGSIWENPYYDVWLDKYADSYY